MISILVLGLMVSPVKAEDRDVKESAVLIQSTNTPSKLGINQPPDYEVIEDSEEIVGDPVAGTKASYESWKNACKDWKKEVRDNNVGSQVISLNCGVAKMEKDGTGSGVYTYKSTGKYRIRVKIRDPK